jgi:DNA-binding NarL/FixJ family response regulator
VTSPISSPVALPIPRSRLGVSAGTIKDHVSSALRKLGVRTRAELAAAVSSQSGM